MLNSQFYGGVEKALFYPQTPLGGLYNFVYFNKSPLGDLGVYHRKLTFSTAPDYYKLTFDLYKLKNLIN